jgi:hypothetical protein
MYPLSEVKTEIYPD